MGRKLTLRAILLAVLTIVGTSPCPAQIAQQIVGIQAAAVAGGSTYTFSQHTYVVEGGASAVASITSPSLTLLSTDVVEVGCSSGASTAISDPASNSHSDAFSHLTAQAVSGTGAEQLSYSLSQTGGPTTFTCTPATSQPYQSMVVRVYNHSGASASYDTDVGGVPTSPFTSPPFSTTSTDLITYFCRVGSGSATFTVGAIGANTGANLSFSAATNSSDAAIEDTQFASAQTSITAKMSSSYSPSSPCTVLALK